MINVRGAKEVIATLREEMMPIFEWKCPLLHFVALGASKDANCKIIIEMNCCIILGLMLLSL